MKHFALLLVFAMPVLAKALPAENVCSAKLYCQCDQAYYPYYAAALHQVDVSTGADTVLRNLTNPYDGTNKFNSEDMCNRFIATQGICRL